MKVKIIGCGNAFSKKSFNQSFLVTENGRNLLIDCGSTVPMALAEAGVKLTDIHDIYISHQHADHIGGLEEVAFTRYNWNKKFRHWSEGKYAPRLIANEGLVDVLWNESLKGGLKSMEGFSATLETFFEVVKIKSGETWKWEGWNIDLIQQIHIMAGNDIMPTFGLMFTKEGHKTVYFTTDSQHCSPRQLQAFYKQADVIFQDCELSGNNFIFDEGAKWYQREDPTYPGKPQATIWPSDVMASMELMAQGVEALEWEIFKFGSGVHANYAELAGYPSANAIRLPAETKAKMLLSHYQDFKLDNKDMYGNTVNWDELAKKDGFAGFLKVGQEFEF
jgi:L-ascorbate metabolism protein UlaG (beta-lactamase superfamily)